MALPDIVEVVRTLVAHSSVSSPDPRHDQSNRAVVDSLAEWAEGLGFRVEVMPLADPTKANLIATLGDGPGGLVLSGHTDTVPFDRTRWSTEPLELVEKDGRLYGRGTADMKGFFGAALHAASRFKEGMLKEPLVLVGTADEESTMNGARTLLDNGRPTARRCVVGEPTGLRPVHMHKGILIEALKITGQSGHSSDPGLGVSALEAMHEAIGALLAIREELQAEHRDEAFAVPVPTLNLGRIEGGDSPNRICPSCSLTFDVRPLPTMDLGETRDRVREAVLARFSEAAVDIAFESLAAGVPAFRTPADAEIVKVAEELTGETSEAVMFCTESPFFAKLGMETIVCGAGSIDMAHQPNEYISRDGLDAATEFYAQLIHRFCVEAP